MTILSLVLSVELVENEFWVCFSILLSQENGPECQENRLEHQENRENVHSELSFECWDSRKRILGLFCYSPEPGE